MRTADVDILIVPGFTGGTPGHWYSRWESKLPTARRVAQEDWDHPDLTLWSRQLETAVRAAIKPTVLVAHSLGVLTVAHVAHAVAEHVVGAFLVAPPSNESIRAIAAIDPAFTNVPDGALPFPAVLVASRDDPYASWESSEARAAAWGAELVDAGISGHINDESGHGPWPEGLMRFAGFLKTLS